MPVPDRDPTELSALKEAQSIAHAIRSGVDLSDVMQIDPTILGALKAYCKEFPGDAHMVLHALSFRAKVRRYVDRLLAGEEIVLINGEEADDLHALEESDKAERANPDQSSESAAPEADGWSTQGQEEPAISEAQA